MISFLALLYFGLLFLLVRFRIRALEHLLEDFPSDLDRLRVCNSGHPYELGRTIRIGRGY